MHQKIILSLVLIFLAHLGLLGKTAGPGDPNCMVWMTCTSKGLCVSFVPSDTLCILASSWEAISQVLSKDRIW